jgi:hypothetical protein
MSVEASFPNGFKLMPDRDGEVLGPFLALRQRLPRLTMIRLRSCLLLRARHPMDVVTPCLPREVRS